MQNRFFLPLSTALALFGAACSNGGGDAGTGDVSIRCAGGQSFCVISCDLGCSQTSCSVTEIAENQRLRWVFSSNIAPASVNRTSVSIRTASGVSPDGELSVSGRELSFVPAVSTAGGTSTFGFRRNEAYIITLPSGANGQGIKSVSGDSLSQEFSCTVLASRGIQDEDALPPSVTLVAPTTTTNVSNTPTIVLRFSELIDTTALQSSLTASSPVNFIVRGTVDAGGTRVCDTDVAGVAIEATPVLTTERVGTHDVTVLTFTPPFTLPGQSCLRVNVTGDLRDLSGRAAVPTTFELLTAVSASVPFTISESFANSTQQDIDQSSGVWSNGARAGLVGEDGRHGSFSLSLATNIPNTTIYEIDTAGTAIPAANTLSGTSASVNDGKFYFSDFVLPANTTLRFKPSDTVTRPVPQIFVRGKVEILGKIDISGADLPFWTPTSGLSNGLKVSDFNGRGTNLLLGTIAQGQVGTSGGVGGGKGGNGGRECNGTGPAVQDPPGSGILIHHGQPGGNVGVPGTHAFAGSVANTGGRGGPLMPATGLTTPLASTLLLSVSAVASPLNNVRCQFSPGGTGGGFSLVGGQPTFTSGPAQPAPLVIGTLPAGGLAFDLSQAVPVGVASLDHFVVGGSGGGGGASHAYGTVTLTAGQDFYVAGAAGTGGGGAMAIRAGGNVSVAANSVLMSRGGGPRQDNALGVVTVGSGVLINGDDKNTATFDATWGVTSPGGGGSGGSFLLQAGGNLTCAGSINTEGGPGSQTGNIVAIGTTLANFNIVAKGGAGSPGFYRLEAGGAVNFTGTGIPAFNAAVHSATLTDRDNVTASVSKWRSSNQFFPPTWLRYELDVDTDGDGVVDITYTDSGAAGTQRANNDTDPVRIRFQGAVLNTAGTAPRAGESAKPWRDGIGSGAGPGIGQDSPTGFRFMLRFNRAVAPDCVVRALRVFVQT